MSNAKLYTPFSTRRTKTILCQAAHLRIFHIWEYPPLGYIVVIFITCVGSICNRQRHPETILRRKLYTIYCQNNKRKKFSYFGWSKILHVNNFFLLCLFLFSRCISFDFRPATYNLILFSQFLLLESALKVLDRLKWLFCVFRKKPSMSAPESIDSA